MFSWPFAEAFQLALQCRVQDPFHQGGLTTAANTGDHREHVQWEGHIDVLQVVFARSA